MNGAFMLDVRSEEEFELGAIEGGAVNIPPNTDLRDRLKEVPKDRDIILNCAMGLRGYFAERILRQNGITRLRNLTGGFKTYDSAMRERELLEHKTVLNIKEESARIDNLNEDGSFRRRTENKIFKVDACGLQCPGPIIRLKKEMDKLEEGGDRIIIKASDPGFGVDVQSWSKLTGNNLVSVTTTEGGVIEAVVEKENANICSMPDSAGEKPSICAPDNGATMVVFSNDLDKALASFVLANGAAASGKQVTMFFTFWGGLSVLRKKHAPKVKKDFMGGKMFSSMLPKGMDELGLSSMNMGGLGAKMMKGRMKKKHVDQVTQMFEDAIQSGVRMVACQMSMDIMGITKEELLDGVEVGALPPTWVPHPRVKSICLSKF